MDEGKKHKKQLAYTDDQRSKHAMEANINHTSVVDTGLCKLETNVNTS